MMRGFALSLLLVLAIPASAADLASEQAKLEGAWSSIEARQDGAAAPQLVGHRLEFTGDRFNILTNDGLVYAGSYRIDPEAEPAQIDFHQEEGMAKGLTWEGIYRIEREKLEICDDAPNPDGPRPTDFTAGSGIVCLVFERSES